jgi:hypothetical protein
MDLKKILNDDKNISKPVENTNIRKHKKPLQLRDIESRSVNKVEPQEHKYKSEADIHTMLEKEKENIYFKPWSKLDNGHKLNRIKQYGVLVKEEYNLSDNDTKKLEKLLINACNDNKLNKSADIMYNVDEGKIIKIKILEIVEKDGKKVFSLKINEKKTKATPKSKTNIDRFLKSGSLKASTKK